MNGIYYAIAYSREADVYEATPRQNMAYDPWKHATAQKKPDPDTDPIAGEGYRFHAGNAQHAARLLRIRRPGAQALYRWCHPVSGRVSWLGV